MTTVGRLLTRKTQVLGLAFLAALSLPFAATTRSQGDGSRQIVLEEFTRARPPATSAKAQASVKTGTRKSTASSVPKGPRYIRKSGSVMVSLKPNSEVMEIGVTIWQLRPSSGNDAGARVLVQENAQTTQWTPQRIEADTQLRVGDHVRLTIESPRAWR